MLFLFGNYGFPVADAQVITQPNRYLIIATSGGLNQQRTGVIFLISVISIISKYI